MTLPTPAGAPLNDSLTPYSSKVVTIEIAGRPFHVHQAKLERLTSFFSFHGESLSTASLPASPLVSGIDSESLFIPQAGDADTSMKEEEVEPANTQGSAGHTADFKITDRFHTVGAFTILTDWLYNEPPKTPTNKAQSKFLLQAYVLARTYSAYPLQNLITDRFRNFHQKFKVDLHNLIWLANRLGDNIDCPLTSYFVEQTAFEITDIGFDRFEDSNLFFKKFLEEGNWKIRLELVKALAKHAQASDGGLGDPAKDTARDWHVEEVGQQAGQPKTVARRGLPNRSARPGGHFTIDI